MASDDRIRESLRWQAEYCRAQDAPVTARLCDALAATLDRSTETGRRTLDWTGEPRADALPLRLAGAFHALWRRGAAPELAGLYRHATDGAALAAGLETVLEAHDGEIAGWLDGPPQTNEPGRSAVLMAGLLALAAEYPAIAGFELIEIGSSAGLNLMIGRYGFDLGGVAIGPADAAIRIAPEWRGPPPPDRPRRIESTRGCDVAPVDLDRPGEAERLLAYVWADRPERLERTARAIALAQAEPPRLDRSGAGDWLKERLKEPQAEGRARVLMHSLVWPYLPAATQLRIAALMAAARGRASPSRPLAWLSYEWPRGAGGDHELRLRSWPGLGLDRLLAYAHPHGAWIDWLSTAPRGR